MSELLTRDDARAGREAPRETTRHARSDAAAAGSVAAARPGIAAWTVPWASGPAHGSDTCGVLSVRGAPPEQHPEHAYHQGENEHRAPRKVGRRCGHPGHERPFTAAAANEAKLGFQLLDRPRILLRQARIELLGTVKLGTREPGIALAGVELGLNVVSLGAGGMIPQHLLHHLLRLIEMTRLRGVVNLLDGGIGVRQGRRTGKGKRESRSRQGTRKQCSHNYPAMAR